VEVGAKVFNLKDGGRHGQELRVKGRDRTSVVRCPLLNVSFVIWNS
jgi:hypothetical protein